MDEETCYFAAEGGQLETLKWLRQEGCPWDIYMCGDAAHARQHWEVLAWVMAELKASQIADPGPRPPHRRVDIVFDLF